MREEEIRCVEGITILEYINEYALTFLRNTTFRKIEGYYYSAEYQHNPIVATYQFYKDLLNEDDPYKLIGLITYIKNNIPPNRVSSCFCRKNVKYRNCHRNAFERIKKLSKKVLRRIYL